MSSLSALKPAATYGTPKEGGTSGTGKVAFLITEVDTDADPALPSTLSTTAPQAASSVPETTLAAKSDSTTAVGTALPLLGVYRVEDAALPAEVQVGSSAPASLPPSIPVDKIMTNIVQNLDFKLWSENARNIWFKDFKSAPSKAMISDTFWFCICWYFKTGRHPEVEKRLFDRISANFVTLFSTIAPSAPSRKDFFFRCYADAVAQAVLYSLFLAYPKSRGQFTERFRKDLVIRVSYWTTGICPEFVDTSHWKLNLGGGDVLQATANSQAWQRGGDNGGLNVDAVALGARAAGGAILGVSTASSPVGSGLAGSGAGVRRRALPPLGDISGLTAPDGSATLAMLPVGGGSKPSNALASQTTMGQLGADTLAGKRASLAHRAPRPMKTLRYSPLVEHFLRDRKYSSINLVRASKMKMTTAEERAKMMDVKHAMLVERATAAREHCDRLAQDYDALSLDVRRQVRQRQLQAQTAKKRLEIRRKEVLRSDPHEYANYLVSLHLLQQGMGQTA